jgi:pyruvate/2-oxoglutarate dehydrogenase complex dihydrolipoamide dehydrogenase (E3) component
MHHGAEMGEDIKDSSNFGWVIDGKVSHDWGTLVSNVQDYISSLNFGHRSECMTSGVQYYNKLVTFVDAHTVECVDRRGKKTTHTADKFLISVGGRPNYPDIPGAKEVIPCLFFLSENLFLFQCCISSDDIFSLDRPPGKTLVVGASYIALECAGFLKAYGTLFSCCWIHQTDLILQRF